MNIDTSPAAAGFIIANMAEDDDPNNEPGPTRRQMDPELRQLSAIIRILDDFDDGARAARIVAYLAARYSP